MVTSERVHLPQRHLHARRGVEIPLDRINTVFFNQGVFERMIRAGDIGIESAGENSRQEFSDIYNPVLVQTTIYRQMEEYENRRQDRLGSVVRGQRPPRPRPSLSVAEQLEKLEQMKVPRLADRRRVPGAEGEAAGERSPRWPRSADP